MTDAPERIWADARLIHPISKSYPGATEYIRIDLYDKAVERAEDAEAAWIEAQDSLTSG